MAYKKAINIFSKIRSNKIIPWDSINILITQKSQKGQSKKINKLFSYSVLLPERFFPNIQGIDFFSGNIGVDFQDSICPFYCISNNIPSANPLEDLQFHDGSV